MPHGKRKASDAAGEEEASRVRDLRKVVREKARQAALRKEKKVSYQKN